MDDGLEGEEEEVDEMWCQAQLTCLVWDLPQQVAFCSVDDCRREEQGCWHPPELCLQKVGWGEDRNFAWPLLHLAGGPPGL